MSARDFQPGNIATFEGTIADDVGRARFSNAMRDELARRRLEGKTGWNHPDVCTIAQLEAHMEERWKAGDLVGTGAALMMLYNRTHPEAPR